MVAELPLILLAVSGSLTALFSYLVGSRCTKIKCGTCCEIDRTLKEDTKTEKHQEPIATFE